MPTLKQLRYFAALADTLHFGKAAARCQVTQPAMSMQIRELEAELGVVLVERTPAGVFLTAAGAGVAQRARGILLAVQDLSELARHRDRVLAGPLRLGVIPTIGPYLLPQVLPRLHASYPEIQLALHESQTEHLLDALVAGELDLLVLALPVGRPEVATGPVRRPLQPRRRGGPSARGPRRGRASRICWPSVCCCSRRAIACGIRR